MLFFFINVGYKAICPPHPPPPPAQILGLHLELTKPYHLPGYQPERVERGGPLLSVETEVKGDSKSTNDRDPSLVGSFGLVLLVQRFLSYLGCSSQHSTKYFFPRHRLFYFFTLHRLNSLQPGQAGVLGRLSLCLWYQLYNTEVILPCRKNYCELPLRLSTQPYVAGIYCAQIPVRVLYSL